MTENRIHKLRAKAYFDLLKEISDEMITFSFDYQKNHVLPKLPDQQAYYSCLIYMYNFTVEGTLKARLILLL